MKIISQSRKCQNCNTWNYDNDYCSNCNNLLNYDIIDQLEAEQRKENFDNRPVEKADLLINSLKNSRYLPVKAIYYLLHSIWFVFISITSFFLALIALGPG